MSAIHIHDDIFKAYDIRGIVGTTLSNDTAELIGRAIATEALTQNITHIMVGRDGRLSGPALTASLIKGITETGIRVTDIGMVATPMLYFAAVQHSNGSGVMITGSHNPPDYNGFKIMLGGNTLSGEEIQKLRVSIQENRLHPLAATPANVDQMAIAPEYIEYIASHIQLKRPMKIVVDAGNGVAGAYVGDLYRALGCEVEEIYCDVDGHFPNHHPDPSRPDNLTDLIRTVKEKNAELGLAFDGDGDRLGVVTNDGHIIFPDRQLMLFSADVLSRHPGSKVIFDIKSTGLLVPWITQHGGQPIMNKTGHSFMKAALKQHSALIAGELSGHVFFQERWFGFDDGLYTGARLLEILSGSDDPSAALNALPEGFSTPELNIHVPDGQSGHQIVEELIKIAHFADEQQRTTVDGLRVEFSNGFGLLRASNTTPILVLRFEGNTAEALSQIQHQFRQLIEQHTQLIWPEK